MQYRLNIEKYHFTGGVQDWKYVFQCRCCYLHLQHPPQNAYAYSLKYFHKSNSRIMMSYFSFSWIWWMIFLIKYLKYPWEIKRNTNRRNKWKYFIEVNFIFHYTYITKIQHHWVLWKLRRNTLASPENTKVNRKQKRELKPFIQENRFYIRFFLYYYI